VRFNYQLTRAADAVTLAEGHTVHASLDRSGRPRRLPDRARNIFEAQ
jgi:acyl-CoA thioesterase FadM